jgi:hypothetical protein
MTGVVCPVNGCDYGEQDEKSLQSVRTHINAKGDDDHDWSELKPEVVEQADDQEDSDDEEQEEPEDDESENEEDMPTEEEYERQHGEGEEEEEQDEEPENSDPEGDSGSDDGSSFDVPIPSLSPMTWLLIVGALVLIFLYLQRSDDSEPIEQSETTESTDESGDAVDPEEVNLVES